MVGPRRATGSGFVLSGPYTSPGQAPSRSSAAASQALSVGSNVRPRALQTLTSSGAVITSRFSLSLSLSLCACVCAVSMCGEQRRPELQHFSSTVIVTFAGPDPQRSPTHQLAHSATATTVNRLVVRRPLTTRHMCFPHPRTGGCRSIFLQPTLNPLHTSA